MDNATVRWSMTRVRCWWKPLSSELSAGPPPCRFAGDERSSPVPTIPVRQEAPPNAEGLGSLTPGGVASLPPHPARLQRANHAEQVGGDDIQQTNKRTDKQTDGQTNKKTHNKFVEGGVGRQRMQLLSSSCHSNTKLLLNLTRFPATLAAA